MADSRQHVRGGRPDPDALARGPSCLDCADLENIDPVTLRGTQLAIRHLARIRERDRSITEHASDYPGQQNEAAGVVNCVPKAILRSGDPPLTHAPLMALVKRPRRAKKRRRIAAFHATEAAWHLFTATKLLGLGTPQGAQFASGITPSKVERTPDWLCFSNSDMEGDRAAHVHVATHRGSRCSSRSPGITRERERGQAFSSFRSSSLSPRTSELPKLPQSLAATSTAPTIEEPRVLTPSRSRS